MQDLNYSIRDWLVEVDKLYEAGDRLNDNISDPQRKKLSYCIMREVLVQCQEINDASQELIQYMKEIEELLDDNCKKIKKLKR